MQLLFQCSLHHARRLHNRSLLWWDTITLCKPHIFPHRVTGYIQFTCHLAERHTPPITPKDVQDLILMHHDTTTPDEVWWTRDIMVSVVEEEWRGLIVKEGDISGSEPHHLLVFGDRQRMKRDPSRRELQVSATFPPDTQIVLNDRWSYTICCDTKGGYPAPLPIL